MGIFLPFLERSAYKAALFVFHQLVKLVSFGDQGHTAGQHGFNHRSAPRFLDSVAERINEEIE